MCGLTQMKNGTVVGDFTDISRCSLDEWCVGPHQMEGAIQGFDYGRTILCAKGK